MNGCAKVAYPTRAVAVYVKRRKIKPYRRDLWPYQCRCGSWHLTSRKNGG